MTIKQVVRIPRPKRRVKSKRNPVEMAGRANKYHVQAGGKGKDNKRWNTVASFAEKDTAVSFAKGQARKFPGYRWRVFWK